MYYIYIHIHQRKTQVAMTVQAKNKIREHINEQGFVELTIVEDGKFLKEEKHTSYDEAVAEVEFYENMDCEVFI